MALMTSDESSIVADSGTTSPVDSRCASRCDNRTPAGISLMMRSERARAFHAADRRERSNVEIGVAGRAAANGLLDDRLGGQRRRELEDLGVCAAVAFVSCGCPVRHPANMVLPGPLV